MKEFSTIAEGFSASLSAEFPFPFVVRNCSEFIVSGVSEQSIRSQIRLEKRLSGYSSHGEGTQYLSGLAALEAYDASRLLINIVDSVSTRGNGLLPCELKAINDRASVDESVSLAFVISPISQSQGELHIDPPFGSGWQYLCVGTKKWSVLDSSTFSLDKWKAEGLPLNLLELALKFDMLEVTIGPGDFVSCPMSWPHSVWTHEASIGLSGYSA
jgi:hypothetical protein